jgi:TonB family protein
MFRGDPAPAPAARDVAPAVSNDRLPRPAPETAATRSTEVEPKVLQPPAAAPSPIDEVIPNVSRSARETIRGTIRVSVRVIVGKDGTVLDATVDEPGPSRYFARLALEASRKWTFAPQDSAEPRVTLVKFYFKRTGTTGHADPLQACKSC